jgi:microcystin degradation protein MlrC
MNKRIGILALLHESNTFVQQPTTLQRFREDLFLEGPVIRDALAASHHEVGGFFAGIDEYGPEIGAVAEPLVAYRATPAGTIAADAFDELVERLLASVRRAGQLDGLLVAPHGAAVSQRHPDADGAWLAELRRLVGAELPIVGTLDAHANLTPQMVDSCQALIAYRTNPHLDQRARGREAARCLISTLAGRIQPTMAAEFPPLVINIERQCTSEPHLQPIYNFADCQLAQPGMLTNSILLGFPYADVPEMGAATIAVTDNDPQLARRAARELAGQLWSARAALQGQLSDIQAALDQVDGDPQRRYVLLDMGDNVGGGSAADGTTLAAALLARRLGPSFVCLNDPDAVQACQQAGVGARLELSVGGKTDRLHGPPLDVEMVVESLSDGRFRESAPRHGGIVEFDQGPTAVGTTVCGTLTLMFSSRRMVPFSLSQLTGCGVQPQRYRVLVAKGVNAPLAAYRDVCDAFVRVNTIGSTTADLSQLPYHHRRHPLYPFEHPQHPSLLSSPR